MATLVLSAVGTALGGPLGGALGSLVGQAIDQSLFGPGIHKGPRLGDLSVQTSSYGSPIPRIYGKMRVAGTVIWSTDIIEDESVEGGGKGSPEYVAYRYSVSFAVALSSRPIQAVRRIWADGKLVRGAVGDFKVKTKFRICSGSEDQPVDPLIASVEMIEQTPAYRGLALAIFEDLDLGEFGNRIPVLTFEVVADEAIGVGDMLRDASGGLIDAADSRPLLGYAAHGASIGDSVAGLVEVCEVQLVDRNGQLRSPAAGLPALIETGELGCDTDGRIKAPIERNRSADKDMPTSLTMMFYDPQRDYQAGQMQASSGQHGARTERIELPAVMSSEQAKAVVEEALAGKYRRGNCINISLPPSRMTLRPGDVIQLGGVAQAWMVRSVTIDGLSVNVEAEAAPVEVPLLPADPGRAVAEPDEPIGRTELLLLEAPPGGDTLSGFPVVHVATASSGAWKAVPVELRLGAEQLPSVAMRRQATIGLALSALDPRVPMVVDELSSVTIRLVGQSKPLLNADDAALMAGANLALLGGELIQFGRAEEVADGTFRLTRLLRGRRGTEWAAEGHGIGEPFCLVEQGILPVELNAGAIGMNITAMAHGVGDIAPLPQAQRPLSGEAMRPPPPCHLRLRRDGAGIVAEWTRRSHRGWAWLDEVGVPDDPFPELYRVNIDGPSGQIAIEATIPSLECALADMSATVGETIRLTVATVGPKAVSHGISTTLTL